LEIAKGAISTFPQRRRRFPHLDQEDKARTHPSAVPAEGIHQRRFLSFLALSFQDHLVLESKRSFSIILRLENAPEPLYK
jgi:hypothetical protein